MSVNKNIFGLILLFVFINVLNAELQTKSNKFNENDYGLTKVAQPCKLTDCEIVCENGKMVNFGEDFNSAIANTTCDIHKFSLFHYVGEDNKIIPKEWFMKIRPTFTIEQIRIENCSFETIEDDVFNSPHFRSTVVMTWSQFKLERLTRNIFAGLSEMKYLFLRYLPLKEIEENVLYSMRYTLNVFIVQFVEEKFSLTNLTGSVELFNIDVLHLRDLALGELTETSLTGVSRVRELVITDSQITSIHQQTFTKFNQNLIRTLALENNKLTTIAGGILGYVAKNNAVKIYIGNNPWACDCNLLGLQSDLRLHLGSFSSALCMSPEKWKGQEVINPNFCP